MLGVHVRLDAARSSGKVTFEPKTETVQKMCALSTHHLQLQSMTPAEASKLRVMAGWCAGNTFGRVGGLGLAQLKKRQYATDLRDFKLDDPLMIGLQFLIFVLHFLAPRSAQIFMPVGQGREPLGYTMELREKFVRLLLPRKTQIFAAEAIIPLMVLSLSPELLVRSDVVWFNDNEATNQEHLESRGCWPLGSSSTHPLPEVGGPHLV